MFPCEVFHRSSTALFYLPELIICQLCRFTIKPSIQHSRITLIIIRNCQVLITNLCCLGEQIRQVELQFTIGEALSCAGAGRMSEVACDPWVVEQLKSSTSGEKEGIMQELIDIIVNKYATSPIPYVRQVRLRPHQLSLRKKRANNLIIVFPSNSDI